MLHRNRVVDVIKEAFSERLYRLDLDLERAAEDYSFYQDRESRGELGRIEETERKVKRLESLFRRSLKTGSINPGSRSDVHRLSRLLVFMAAYFEDDAEGYDQEETDHRLSLAHDLREAAKPVNLSQITG